MTTTAMPRQVRGPRCALEWRRKIAVLISKTEAGRREVQERKSALPRTARTLLVLADGARTQEELLQFVRGAELGDIETLIEAGLVVASAATSGSKRTDGAPGVPQSTSAKPGSATDVPFAESGAARPADPALAYQELYSALNLLCRDHLGLIKGFRYSIEIEKAAGFDELKAVAKRFAAEVEQTRGPATALMVRRALYLGEE
jgi:hypothetical protein